MLIQSINFLINTHSIITQCYCDKKIYLLNYKKMGTINVFFTNDEVIQINILASR